MNYSKKYIISLMEESGTYKEEDEILIDQVVRLYKRIQAGKKSLTADGFLIKLSNGMSMANPAINDSRQCEKELRITCDRLGFSPDSRKRIDIQPDDPDGFDDD